MGVTVFHSLTATTPDNTQYEIRPSHWNSNHAVSLSIAGSDLSNAFSNSPTVTFGTSGGLMTASVNTNYAVTNITTNNIATSQSSLFQQTSATSAITSAAFASSNSSLLIATSNSSLFQQTSATSAITSNALNTSASRVINLVAATDTTGGGTASLSGNVSFGNTNGITFYTSAGGVVAANHALQFTSNTSAITANAFPSAQTTKFAGTGTTFAGTNITATIGLNSNGLALSLSGNTGGGGGGIAAAAGTQTATSGTVVFSNSNGISFGMSNSSVVTASYTVPTVPTAYVSSVNGSSGAISLNVGSSLSASTNGSSITFGLASNITTALQSAGAYLTTAAQSSASNVSVVIAGTAPGGGTASLSGGVSFSNANGISFYTSAGNAVVASYTVPTVPTAYVSSVNGSSGAISLNVGSSLSASTNGSSITFGLASNITTALQSAGAYLTTAAQSSASNVSLIIAGTAPGGGTASLSGGVSFSNANNVSFYTSAGNAVVASVPGTSSISGTGAVSISTNGATISIGAPAMSVGLSNLGNTSGNTGTVSNQFVLAGGNNITLSGSTNAAGMTVTVSANTAAAANLSVSAGTTSGAFGGITFANSNNVTFGLNNGTITASVPSGGGGIAAAAGTQTQTSGTVLFSNSNGITFGMSNSSVITASYTVPTVPTAYVSSVNGSSGAISLNVGSSLSASTNGSSITFGLASNITTALQSAGAYLTTAAQSSASNVSQVIVGTAAGGGTATLTGGVSFSNANGISFYSSAGNAVVASYTVPTVPTAYVSSVNGSSGAISLNVGSSLSASTNGSSITFGLASNITTALQSAGAYLTTAAQSSASNVSLIIAGTAAGGGTASLSGGVSFSNANGISFYTSAGNAVVASYTVPAVPTAYVSSVNGSSGAISLNVGSSLSASTNGSSITFGLASNITTALQSAGAYLTTAAQSNQVVNSLNGSTGQISLNVGSSLSASTNGSSITFGLASNITTALQSANANYLTSQSNQAFSASGGSSAFQTLNFANSNGLTFSNSGGSVIASYTVPTQTNQTVGFYASSQTTGQSSSSTFDARSMSFVGAGGISVGASNGSIIFSGATGGAGGGIAFANSQTTYTSGTVSLREGGGAITIASNTGQRIDISVPAQSSIYGVSGILISTNGSSISIANDFDNIFIPEVAGASTTYSAGQNTLMFAPLFPGDNYSFSCFELNASFPATSSGVNTQQAQQTISYALYRMDTNNASRMSLLSSSSMFVGGSMSSNNNAAFTVNFNNSATSYSTSSAVTGVINQIGGRAIVLRMPFSGTMQAGEIYYMGIANSHTFSNASQVLQPVRFYGGVPAGSNSLGYLGPDTYGGSSANMDFMGFYYTATSGAWPSTIATNETSMNSSGFSPYIAFKNLA